MHPARARKVLIEGRRSSDASRLPDLQSQGMSSASAAYQLHARQGQPVGRGDEEEEEAEEGLYLLPLLLPFSGLLISPVFCFFVPVFHFCRIDAVLLSWLIH